MNKNTLIVFIAVLILLSGAFSFFHYTEITSLRQETIVNTPKPHRMRDDLKQIMIPNEFIDYVKQSDGNAQGSLSAEEFSLKKLGFTACLYEMSSSTNFWKKEGSEDAFTKASGGSIYRIDSVEELAIGYARKHKATSQQKKALWVSECLDFYDSSELKEVVKHAATLP